MFGLISALSIIAHVFTVSLWTWGSVRASREVHTKLLTSILSSTFRFALHLVGYCALVLILLKMDGLDAHVTGDTADDTGHPGVGWLGRFECELHGRRAHWVDPEGWVHRTLRANLLLARAVRHCGWAGNWERVHACSNVREARGKSCAVLGRSTSTDGGVEDGNHESACVECHQQRSCRIR
jgi:hypothetical protein